MALTPNDANHALQILAGTEGRIKGHQFEISLSKLINDFKGEIPLINIQKTLLRGNIVNSLLSKTMQYINCDNVNKIEAIALGALATAEEGKQWLEVHGIKVRACKSDILLSIYSSDSIIRTIGVSVKQCNNKTPTNAQLFFTTANAFIELLRSNNIPISENGLNAMKQFCGDIGFRPMDDINIKNRIIDQRRFFWEEINEVGKLELEKLFTEKQKEISKLLFQKAYKNDPFIPELLLHKTKLKEEGLEQEYALYTIDELVDLSYKYGGFNKEKYRVKTGSGKEPIVMGNTHEAPRFGIIQMQRGGQTQHPTQLQFNLKAGYFYHI